MRGFDQSAHLVVDLARDLGGVVTLRAHAAAEERIALLLPVAHSAELGAHAVFGDHRTCDLGRLVDVRGRACRRLMEDQLLRCATAHGHHQTSDHLRARHQVFVLLGHGERVTARSSTREDRHLVDRVEIGHRPRGERVTALVVRDNLLLVFADDPALAPRSADDAVDRLLEHFRRDDRLVLARGEQRGLVDDVGEVGARHSWRALGQAVEVGVLSDGLALGMHLEDGPTTRDVGIADGDLPVETSRTQQCRVEDVGTVGRCDQDHARAVAEPVHLHEQLIQRLLALVVTTAETGTTLTADGVDLVDEDDARAVVLGLLEQIAHTRRTDTDEHLDEVGTGNGEERHARLACDCPRKQGLTGAGRTVEQHAARNLGAERLVARRVLQEVLDLVQLFDGLVGTRDIGEGGLGHVLGQLLGLGLAEAHHAALTTTLHAVHDEEEEPEQQQHREQEDHDLPEHRLLRHVGLVAGPGRLDRVEDLLTRRSRILGRDLRDILAVDLDRILGLDPQLLFAIIDLDELGVLGVELCQRDRGVNPGVAAIAIAHRAPAPQGEHKHREYREVTEDCLSVHAHWWRSRPRVGPPGAVTTVLPIGL